MKKLFLILALILTLVFAFAACKGHTHAFDQKNVGDAYLKSNANETSPAEYYYSCKCGKKGTETFTFGNAIGGAGTGDEAHIFRTEWTSNDEKHWQSCLDLSCDVRKNEANHTFGEWVIDKEPTCVKEGTKHRTCAVCGKSVSETIPVNPTAHNYATTWTTDGTNHWHKCQNSGCTSVLEKAPHAWDEENTCTVCQRYKDDGVKFMKMSDGTYQVSGYTGSASEVIIPSVYNGIAVTTIGYLAFSGCDSLTSITIPDSVTTIGERAFYNCTNLTSITIPDSVTTIGERAFFWCYSLTSITIPASVTSIGNCAFWECSSLTNIAFGENSQLTTIGSSAFYSCDSLTSITFGENSQLTTIGDSAFHGCISLTSITIPASVTSIGDYAFCGCYSLTSITFGGTKAQWESISKNVDLDCCDNWLTIYCTDGYITVNDEPL